jgi:hypothetical protein
MEASEEEEWESSMRWVEEFKPPVPLARLPPQAPFFLLW